MRLLTGPPNQRRTYGSALTAAAFTLLALLFLLAMVATAGPALAQSAPAPEIVDAKIITSTKSVVRITVRSPRPVSGELRCTCNRVTTRVDLPTGGEKVVWIPLGTLQIYFSGQIIWDIPGSKDPEAPINGGNQQRPIALGVLPSALGSRSAPASVSTRGRMIIDVIELVPDDIEQRAWLLDGFAVLATTSKELGSLSEAGRRSVLSWVERGGELLIDDADPVPDLVTQPTEDRSATFGLGTVRRTANALRTGRWEAVMLPANQTEAGSQTSELSISLKDAVRLAPAGALLAGLLVYAMGVGPLAYMLGRRRNRPMLMWVAVPLTAAVTTVGVLGIGFALRRTASDQYVLFRLHGTSADRTTVLRALVDGSSPNNVRIPTGWTAEGDLVKINVGTVSTASVDLAPGGLTEVRFTGDTAPTTAPLAASLDAIGNVTVTNTSSSTVRTLHIVNGDGFAMTLPDLAAGASTTVTFSATPTYGTSAAEEQQTAVTALIVNNTVLRSGAVVVVGEIDPTSAPGVPSAFTNKARATRQFAAVSVVPSGARVTRSPGTSGSGGLTRIDLPPDAQAYELRGVAAGDTILIGSDEFPAVDGPLPPGAIENGALVLRSQTATVVEAPATEFVQ